MRKPRQLISDSIDRVREVQHQPSVVLTWIKQSLVSTWLLRGGGFYGLGYLVTFIILQAQSLATDFVEAEDALSFLGSQIFQILFKFFTDVIGNLIQAFIWPLMFLNLTGSWGLLILIVGFVGFDRWGKPYINQRIPELHAADLKSQEKLGEKRAKKQAKQQAKDAKEARKQEKKDRKTRKKEGSNK